MSIIDNDRIIHIDVNQVASNPFQPRKLFEEESLLDLAQSIETYGVMQPITVRRVDDQYELIAGERRLRASKLAGLGEIPAVLISATDEVSTVLALIENLQRENLNFMEEAEGYYNLINDYQLTQKQLAAKVGKSQSTVANKLRLLNLDPAVVEILFANNLSERHARALLTLETTKLQLKVVKVIVKKGLNVKQTEAYIKSLKESKPEEDKPVFNVKHYLKDIRIFTNTIKQTVDMMKDAGMDVGYKIEQEEEGYQITINIPLEQRKESE